MYDIEVTNRFLKDLKLARKRNLDENKLNDIVKRLANGEPLPEKNRDHALVGDYRGCRECHITPDWLLIYSVKDVLKIITLIRTGTHSDLF
ncbi:MAG: type II toxin-antitoxin system YafQ family toxin [Bacteroidales bacterium]|nr:type II toxin-antitoxin system YafQ family toxin [Bacteroidales bacterium]